MPYGFSNAAWMQAKAEITRILQDRAQQRGMITYTELTKELHAITLDPHEPAMGRILGEISTAEAQAGRGMLSVIVVHKQGDMEPGNGFYECADNLGYDTTDHMKFWVNEL